MLFRTVLVPFIRIFQWSGLSPFLVIAENPKSFWRSKAFQLTAITMANLLINFSAGIHNVTTFSPNYRPDGVHSKLVAYTHMVMGLLLRIHAITVLIESFTKRSTQTKLLATFDEIEHVFANKLNHKIDKRRLRTRFCKFINFWICRDVAMALLATLNLISAFKWINLYNTSAMFVPLYTYSLFYAQWMVYADVIRFNVSRLNECLRKMSDEKGIDQPPTDGQIHRVRATSISTIDVCARLTHLRECFCKIWHASILFNRYCRWSLLIGSGIDLYLLVVNLYRILYCLMNFRFNFARITAAFGIVWAVKVSANFLVMSVIGEAINTEVSYHFRPFSVSNINSWKSEFQTKKALFMLHRLSIAKKRELFQTMVN